MNDIVFVYFIDSEMKPIKYTNTNVISSVATELNSSHVAFVKRGSCGLTARASNWELGD